MLQLTFLGTSAGVPTKQRNVTALAIECLNPYRNSSQSSKKRPWLLIDCGEGTQQQLLYTKRSLHQLIAICITHVHGDHCYGLPGLLASAAMSGRTTPLTIIAPKAIAALLEAVKSTTALYLPYTINFIAIEDILANVSSSLSSSETNNKASNANISLPLDDQHHLTIDVTPLSHRVPSHAFGITQTISHLALNTDKLKAEGIPTRKLWGELQQGRDVYTDEGRQLLSADYVHEDKLRTRIVVAGDNDTPALLTPILKEATLLVHEATYTCDVLTKMRRKVQEDHTDNVDSDAIFDPMHSSVAQVAKFAQDSRLKNLILTHFSARYQSFDNPQSTAANMSHIRLEAQACYQGNLWLAEDFAQYRVTGTDHQVEYLGSARKS